MKSLHLKQTNSSTTNTYTREKGSSKPAKRITLFWSKHYKNTKYANKHVQLDASRNKAREDTKGRPQVRIYRKLENPQGMHLTRESAEVHELKLTSTLLTRPNSKTRTK